MFIGWHSKKVVDQMYSKETRYSKRCKKGCCLYLYVQRFIFQPILIFPFMFLIHVITLSLFLLRLFYLSMQKNNCIDWIMFCKMYCNWLQTIAVSCTPVLYQSIKKMTYFVIENGPKRTQNDEDFIWKIHN